MQNNNYNDCTQNSKLWHLIYKMEKINNKKIV